MINIAFLIRSLETGGAERQLALLAISLKERGYNVRIFVFYQGGSIEQELKEKGISVVSLEKKGRYYTFHFLLRFLKEIKKFNPHILHGYLTVSNLLTLLIKVIQPNIRVIWGLRASNMDLSQYDKLSQITGWLESKLSKFPHHIIVNSYAGLSFAKSQGFEVGKMTVIPNGIDVTRFQIDPLAREKLRKEWKIEDYEILIGIVARLDPMKDHTNFFEAALILSEQRNHLRFICVGSGNAIYKEKLMNLKSVQQLGQKILWLENYADIEKIYNALDLLCSTSAFGEGFSNVIAEAMACGCPVVVTDVGDSQRIVQDPKQVVQIKDAIALVKACHGVLDNKPNNFKIRNQIIDNFSIQSMTDKTDNIIRALVRRH